jgi:hypothetical protein
MPWLDLVSRTGTVQLLKPQTIANNTTGSAIDMQDFPEEAIVTVNVGTITDGGYIVKVYHCATSDGTFEQLTDANDAPVQTEEFTSGNDEKAVSLRITGYQRYIKAVVTKTTAGSTGGIIGATVTGVYKAV